MQDLPTIRVTNLKTEYKGDKAIDWVEFAPVSAIMTNRVWERIEKLRPPKEIQNDDEGKKMAFMRHRWAMIEPAYEAWKSGQEIPVNGTPLAAWSTLTREQVQGLQRLGLKTVEDVAELTDSTIGKIPFPQARELPKQAKMFLEGTDRAKAVQEMADRDAKIAALEEQLAAAMELLAEHTKGKPKIKDSA